MSNTELQEEEREVLLSIYDGDKCFKDISPTTYQYKYGEENTPKSFLLEISWTEAYPNEKPVINMDTFYNKHISSDIKDKVVEKISLEADQYLGAAMTYTLFEFVKEQENDLTNDLPESFSQTLEITEEVTSGLQDASKKAPKKEILSKAQKRKQWNRVDAKGEKPRGWNWVDIVKHLSQTGKKESPETELPTSNFSH